MPLAWLRQQGNSELGLVMLGGVVKVKAQVGDKLIVEGDSTRIALIIALTNEDGTPPYVVKWLADGHISMVLPSQYSRILVSGDS
jgi:hypothetical protein